MTPAVISKLRKVAGLLASNHPGEQLAALDRANALLTQHKLTWGEVIVGESAAPQQHRQPPPLVPAGTRCRLRVEIRPGEDGVLHASRDRKSKARYLVLSFTVLEPERCAGAQFRDRFGMYNRAGLPTGFYAEEGRAHIRRMAQSAGIRLAKPGDLDGIEIEAMVGIRQRSFKDATGEFENHITAVLLPGRDGSAS